LLTKRLGCRILMVATLLIPLTACTGSESGACQDPPFAASDSIVLADSCPQRVATSTAVYDVSCLEIPERALTDEEVDVTDGEEERFIGFGVEGRRIKGLPVEEIFALSFEQRYCGKPGWYSAFSPEMSDNTKAELERRFAATFSDRS
jgi:hypothetical protein